MPCASGVLDFRPSVDRPVSVHQTKRTGAAPSQIFPSARPKLASDVTLAGTFGLLSAPVLGLLKFDRKDAQELRRGVGAMSDTLLAETIVRVGCARN